MILQKMQFGSCELMRKTQRQQVGGDGVSQDQAGSA